MILLQMRALLFQFRRHRRSSVRYEYRGCHVLACKKTSNGKNTILPLQDADHFPCFFLPPTALGERHRQAVTGQATTAGRLAAMSATDLDESHCRPSLRLSGIWRPNGRLVHGRRSWASIVHRCHPCHHYARRVTTDWSPAVLTTLDAGIAPGDLPIVFRPSPFGAKSGWPATQSPTASSSPPFSSWSTGTITGSDWPPIAVRARLNLNRNVAGQGRRCRQP